MIVGLLHPGEMGAAVGEALVANGHDVLWASEGRSAGTHERAVRFRDVGTVAAVAERAEVVLSVCPPHAALDVARACRGPVGIFVDANAISPGRAAQIAAILPRFVDGGIVGGPPSEPGTTLYLTGEEAGTVAALFDGTVLETRVVGNASALKMAYAAWTK
ncbi:MAG: NAD(P)-binding domain-containing protein, partial [Gaiellaceae bacterium]